MSDDVHTYFSLSYASYLVLPRVLLEQMPGDWQQRFVACLDELGDVWKDEAFGDYKVQRVEGECSQTCTVCDDDEPDPTSLQCRCEECTHVVTDHLREYRHPDMNYLDILKK